jgi:hypothetical protein
MSKSTDAPERTFSQGDVDKIVQDRLTRDRQTRVVSEPRVYSLDSPNSYYLDTIMASVDPMAITHRGAHERLNRYAVELAHEIESRSAEGRRAEKIIRERTRVEGQDIHEQRFRARMKEIRAVTTAGGVTVSASTSASVFVAPAFLQAQYALWRGVYRTFADQCHQLPLPAYGMEVYLPFFAATDAAAQQAELSGVSEADPTTGLQGSPVVTVAGQLVITQQLEDRFSGGGAADALFARDLQQRLAEKVDVFALNNVIAGGGNIAGATSFGTNSLANFYGDISKGREGLTDTAGVRLRPTHLFTTYDLFSFVSDTMGSDGRPMIMPQYAPGLPPPPIGADDGLNGGGDMPKWARFTGTILPGGLFWFTDDNIPPAGSNTQFLVSAPDQAVVIMESPEPVLMVSPQTYAGSLSVVVSLYEYTAVITRHASGTSVITGAAYPTSAK